MNIEQEALARLPIGNVLAIAPAGCGKTESLAERARAVLERGEVLTPRRILALTFSNKARDNLASRMRKVVGAGWRQRITVSNFHGLSARVVRAHGRVLNIAEDFIPPLEPWRRRAREELGLNFRTVDAFDTALREAKMGRFDDDDVMNRLVAIAHREAIAYEERLRLEGRLDHDDLIRHAARLLAVPEVSRLYRAHFGMVLVDEVQDLSLLQYEMVRSVGGDFVTYAGDPAQGIYTFAGAAPDEVFARIHALEPEIVHFNKSYRSSPAVLAAVNVLAQEIGSSPLECGDPTKWSDDGQVIYLERADTNEEGEALLRLVEAVAAENPAATIGVVGRRGTRMAQLRYAAGDAGVTFEDWAIPTHVSQVVQLMRRNLRAAAAMPGSPEEILDELERLSLEAIDPADVTTADELVSACDTLREMLAGGVSVEERNGKLSGH